MPKRPRRRRFHPPADRMAACGSALALAVVGGAVVLLPDRCRDRFSVVAVEHVDAATVPFSQGRAAHRSRYAPARMMISSEAPVTDAEPGSQFLDLLGGLGTDPARPGATAPCVPSTSWRCRGCSDTAVDARIWNPTPPSARCAPRRGARRHPTGPDDVLESRRGAGDDFAEILDIAIDQGALLNGWRQPARPWPRCFARSPVARLDALASLRTSSATTAKPRPALRRAADRRVQRRRLVWSDTSLISLATDPIARALSSSAPDGA